MIEKSFLRTNIDHGPFQYANAGVTLFIRQLAANEPIAGGNKLYKMKYNLIKARAESKSKILTFGGAFSNHIAATAHAGKTEGFQTLGIIRGEESAILNTTLSRAASEGMKFKFISREDYKRKNDLEFLKTLISDLAEYYIIPEGGANAEGVKGCMEILDKDNHEYNYVIACCGTGTTAAGIIMSMKPTQKFIGISVLRDNGYIEEEIKKWMDVFNASHHLPLWEINHDFHFGGYAKKNEELELYCKTFYNEKGIAIEPVYTGKMFWGIEKLIDAGYFKAGSNILAIHTGGLQYLL